MSQPPLPPSTLNYATPQAAGINLRVVAIRQKAIMYCILAYIASFVATFMVPPELQLVLWLVCMAASVAAAVFVFMLAIALFSPGVGVVLGILTLIPVIGLIILLIVNGKATNVLRAHGISVGLMGAKSSQIPSDT